MTSGVFHRVPLDSIIVKRDERQRQELSGIESLADSINRLGLIHPLVVTRALELVAGERRYTAIRSLGWLSVPVQYVDELEPDVLQAIELEENIKRQDIEWQDRVKAIKKYHDLRASKEPAWNLNDTSKAIGLSRQQIGDILMISEEIEAGNKLVIEAPKLTTAEGIARRMQERRHQQTIEKLHAGFEGVQLHVESSGDSITTGDFTEWALLDGGPKFNFIHCDFPYGIEADTFNQGAASAFGGYADTPETWERLMSALEIVTREKTGPSCHLMFWFAMRKGSDRLYEPTARALERIGWTINPMPLIWIKSDGTGIIPDPQRGPRQIYETCLFGSLGDRKIIRAKANAYSCPADNKFHMSTKPEPMLKHFFEMVVDETTVMLDPTCGSGSALRAAEALGARFVYGLETNPEFATMAREALKKARSLRAAAELVT